MSSNTLLKSPVKSFGSIPWFPPVEGDDSALWRYEGNPIVGPKKIPCALGIYNSGVVKYGEAYVGVFRVDHMSTIPYLHLGYSQNGLDWKIEEKPINFTLPDGSPSNIEWAYDPRLVKIEGKFYITWCNGYHGPTIGIAETTDFEVFTQLENAFLPFNRNGVLFPEKIGGKFAMFSRPSDNGHTPFGDIFLSHSPDMEHWGQHRWVMGSSFELGWWQSTKIGAGSIPIRTPEGWLSFYHGVTGTCNGYIYSIGASLHDLEQPDKVIYRSKDALLVPECDYETIGRVANVCFPCSALYEEESGKITVYYGAADTHMAVAFTTFEKIMDHLRSQ